MAPLDEQEITDAIDSKPTPLPRGQRAASATWRLAVLLVVIAGVGLVLANSLRVYFAQAQDIVQVKAEIAAQQERIAEIEDQLNRWDDPEYVRSVARVRLGWVMPGETGYRVIGADGKPLEGAVIDSPEAEEPGLWWEKMWGSVQVADAPAPEPTPEPTPQPEITIQPPSPSPSR